MAGILASSIIFYFVYVLLRKSVELCSCKNRMTKHFVGVGMLLVCALRINAFNGVLK